VIAGNCGISAAPLKRDMELPMPLNLLDAPAAERFTSVRGYFAALRRKPPRRQRGGTGGPLDAARGHQELWSAKRRRGDRRHAGAAGESLDAGAIGLSTGTFYPPAVKATTEEIIEVGRPLSSRKRASTFTHMRDESSQVMEALEETFRIPGASWVCRWSCRTTRCRTGRTSGARRRRCPSSARPMGRQTVCLDCYPLHRRLHDDPHRPRPCSTAAC
jgi:N-acyl-D-amino-acid deacylase